MNIATTSSNPVATIERIRNIRRGNETMTREEQAAALTELRWRRQMDEAQRRMDL